MRNILLIIFIMLSSFAVAQKDTTLTIRVSSIREFPQIGLDLKGRKYFVMSTRQDKAALIALQQGLYADSILTRYEELEHNCDSTISLLRGRVKDRQGTIDAQQKTIAQLEKDYEDMKKQRDNNAVSIEALNTQVRNQRIPMWVGAAAIIVGGLVLLDNLTD